MTGRVIRSQCKPMRKYKISPRSVITYSHTATPLPLHLQLLYTCKSSTLAIFQIVPLNTMSALGTKPKATLEGMPPEVMAMIVRATDRNDTPNLTVKDLSSLLLTSRRVRDSAFYAVWQRLFAMRRYMLSRASLKNLDNNSKFGGVGLHVHQVVIGPECINSNAASLLALLPKNKKMKWTQQYQSIWRSLVEDQAQFEANNDDISSLSESLMRLDKLENVKIDSFPFVAGAEAWRAACGSGSLLNKLGDKQLDDQYTVGASRVLMNHSSNMFGHYDHVLEALSAIADKPNWTLDIRHFDLGTIVTSHGKANQPLLPSLENGL
jgi:hypothetical protein